MYVVLKLNIIKILLLRHYNLTKPFFKCQVDSAPLSMYKIAFVLLHNQKFVFFCLVAGLLSSLVARNCNHNQIFQIKWTGNKNCCN